MSAADSALADSMPALAQWLATAPVAAVLLWLADPEKPAPGPGSLDPARSAALIELARAHGVYGIVWRKLHGGVVDVEEVVHALGQSMLLDRLRQQIVGAFAAAGIAASRARYSPGSSMPIRATGCSPTSISWSNAMRSVRRPRCWRASATAATSMRRGAVSNASSAIRNIDMY